MKAASVEHGVDLPVRFFSGARTGSGAAPARPTPEDVFVDARGQVPSASRQEPSPAARGQRALPRMASPAPTTERDRPKRSGLGLLIPGGVLGALAGLARLPIIVVGDAHVACRADPALENLAPCEEQAVMHRAAFATASALYAASLPLLVSGARIRGRFVTLHRQRSRPLGSQRARRRIVAGLGLVAGGALALVSSYGVGIGVTTGSCDGNACYGRLVATEASWWAGVAALTSGGILLAHTLGRRLPVGSRRTRVRILPFAARSVAGASLCANF